MYDLEIHGRDPGVPNKNKTSAEKFQDIGSLLFDVFQFPETYKIFPSLPQNIFDVSEKRISQAYSIIKKGAAYHIVYRGLHKGGKFIETFHVFSQQDIAFSFSEFDFPDISQLDPDLHEESLGEGVFNTLVFDILNVRQGI